MRRVNTILAAVLLVMTAVHLLLGTAALLGLPVVVQTPFALLLLTLAAVHALLSLLLTFRGATPKGLAAYGRENCVYWLRRATGIGVFVLALAHRTLFVFHSPFGVLLKDFGVTSLAVQLLFLGVLLSHILLNLRPLLIGLGSEDKNPALAALKSIALLLAAVSAAGAVCYFLGVGI